MSRDAGAGKFPGILETFHGRNFKGMGIFGNFQFQLISTFYEIVYTIINRTEFSLHYIQIHLFCITFLTVFDLYRSIERTTRLYYEISLDLIC